MLDICYINLVSFGISSGESLVSRWCLTVHKRRKDRELYTREMSRSTVIRLFSLMWGMLSEWGVCWDCIFIHFSFIIYYIALSNVYCDNSRYRVIAILDVFSKIDFSTTPLNYWHVAQPSYNKLAVQLHENTLLFNN